VNSGEISKKIGIQTEDARDTEKGGRPRVIIFEAGSPCTRNGKYVRVCECRWGKKGTHKYFYRISVVISAAIATFRCKKSRGIKTSTVVVIARVA